VPILQSLFTCTAQHCQNLSGQNLISPYGTGAYLATEKDSGVPDGREYHSHVTGVDGKMHDGSRRLQRRTKTSIKLEI
jgi:hypothetical protein